MPVITANIKPEWLDDASEDDDPLKRGLMASILVNLRGIVLDVLNEVDKNGRRRELDEIVLKVVPIHPWSENVPDLWVEIRTAELQGADHQARTERRWAIARGVSGSIFHYLDRPELMVRLRPSYDVECLPQAASGQSRDNYGRGCQQWGMPDPAVVSGPQFIPDRDEGRGDTED